MEATPSKAQVKAIDGLIDGSLTPDSVNSRTYEVLVREGWVNEDGVVSQAGLTHSTHPTVEVQVVLFGKAVTYTHQQFTDDTKTETERVTVEFPKGTEMLITFAHNVGTKKRPRVALEGMINVKGSPMWVRIYKAPHMKLVKRLMPDRKAIENGRTD